MATITLQGNEIHTVGELPEVGSKAPNFTLVANDLSRKSISDYLGNKIILNIFPSIDTGTCAASVRAFNKLAASAENVIVLCISRDLPFAQSRFCGAEGIKNVETLSDLNGDFGRDYHLTISDGPLEGLLSRAVIVIDASGVVAYTEQVKEIADEPNYDAALQHI